jgi:hypothetical protein
MDVAANGSMGDGRWVSKAPKWQDPRRERESDTRIKTVDASQEQVLRRTRRKAHTLRNQGWNYEIQGREAAFREASEVVKKWLLKDIPVTKSDVEFVVELLEQSADLYASARPKKK